MGRLRKSIKRLFVKHGSSAEYYRDINTDVVGLDGTNTKKWMNVGYWIRSENYNDACEDMADKMAEIGDFSDGTTVLDVGCGCGEQDFYWCRKYPFLKVEALDITDIHIDIAKKRKDREPCDVNFRVGNAKELPFANDRFSRVCAMDCAYHFDLREDFLREAFRVLAKGGKLVVSEMLPVRGKKIHRARQIKGRCGLFIPEGNMYPIDVYKEKLKDIGFRNIKSEAAGAVIYKGMVRYCMARYLNPRKPINKIKVKFNRKRWPYLYQRIFGWLYGTEEYYFISAQK